ncbi:MAG: TlpA disulfide reductase family protein [Acidobacteriaceae bacterium]
MRRNILVLSAMVVALGLMIAAGVMNYVQRRRAAEAQAQMMKMTLVPADGSSSDSTNAADEAMTESADEAEADSTGLNGKMAPNFTLADVNGKKVSLDSFRGHPLVVDFWATWCGPCKVEIPWFEKLHDQYASQGLEILGVSADDLDKDDPAKLFTEKRDIADFAQKMHMNYPVLIDADSIANSYGGLDALPTTFFIDKNGKIVASTVGLAPRDVIEADIEKAIHSGASS